MAITFEGGCGGGGGGQTYAAGTGIAIANNEISANRNETNTYTMSEVNDMLAPTEENPALAAHAVGEYIIVNGVLYRVTTAITAGDALVIDAV